MYELLYIVPSPLTEKELPVVSEKIKIFIEELGGKIIKEENLGNKKLAYQIKQVFRGFYILVSFEMETTKIKNLNDKLRLMPEVLRHMITIFIPKIGVKKQRVSKKAVEDDLYELKNPKEAVVTEKLEEKNNKKINLKNLGEKIDDLFKI